MESSGMLEEFTDWEEIEFPFDNQTSSPSAQHLDLEMGIMEREELPLQLQEDCEALEYVPSSPPSPSVVQGWGTDPPHQEQIKSDSKLSAVMSEVKTVVCAVGKRMIAALGCGFRCPAYVPAAALAVVILTYMKIVQGRNRLLRLIGEKEQRISQLLRQISRMNEVLSARRRVTVLRIN